MNDYFEASGKDRLAFEKLINVAIKEGKIPPKLKCQICDKTTGRIDYHSETYTLPFKDLFQICQGCHGRWHYIDKPNNKAFIKYFIEEKRYKKLNKFMAARLKEMGYLK